MQLTLSDITGYIAAWLQRIYGMCTAALALYRNSIATLPASLERNKTGVSVCLKGEGVVFWSQLGELERRFKGKNYLNATKSIPKQTLAHSRGGGDNS